MEHGKKILIIDFGSQYTQLIARRIRESNVYSEVHPHTFSFDEIKEFDPAGIILSGGPMSIYDKDAHSINSEIFQLGIPVLGICYGLQLIASEFGGRVEPAISKEYGKASLEILIPTELFNNVKNNSTVWMSHGDYITKTPEGFEVTAQTENSPVCAISNSSKQIYGLQFHPEVVHSLEGKKILDNFIFEICKCKPEWTPKYFLQNEIEEIKNIAAGKKAICALSGGVDSSVAAILVSKAIGDNLICIHVDNGLMRKNESAEIVKMFEENFNLHLIHVDASEMFLGRLKGVIDPEEKRKIIGKTFIEVFEKEAEKFKDADFLIQGTLYPDVIESVSVKGKSATIKTHHNVGGLPEKMNFKLIEPFRELFKDEVRAIGRELGLPEHFINRHPFPGPGLAVRVLGEISKRNLDILREADKIFIEELHKANLYNEIWQGFAVILPVQTVGVMGDARSYENVVALRAVVSTDGMTADWFRFEPDFLENVSNKIIRNVKGINRVVYDISSKPPSTIEWE
ncbi:MAG: glutamine-hydrolyzing GMP synthase [Ignavibacteriae bacterium]|nr:glutamine-hydrolyzing GMP synthase [Ignavibacteriota bacterium]NOG96707.1 glutamine-hydrolyzing GMP synthase [Ignavibacteriota bacterium]